MDDSAQGKERTASPGNNGRAKPPGLKEIAAYLNLSPATVSMVINDVPLAKSLSEETRARVQAAAKLFNYRPNLVARALSKRESRTVGVIAPEASDGYFTRVMRGIETGLLEAGYLYFTASHLGRRDLIEEYPNALTQRGVDGLIFVNTPVLEHPGVPAVSISDACRMEGVTSILVEQRNGMLQAMRHLAQMGHRRIVVMRGSASSLDADDRYDSIVLAARALGLPIFSELVLTLETNQLTPEIGYRAIADLLEAGVDFTAVFAFNDMSALGALRALQDFGRSCPGDVSVLGIDDISTATYMLPRLSTCAQPLEAMGAAAAAHLIAKIQRPHEERPTQVLFPMELAVRESTGPAPRVPSAMAGAVLLEQRPSATAPQER